MRRPTTVLGLLRLLVAQRLERWPRFRIVAAVTFAVSALVVAASLRDREATPAARTPWSRIVFPRTRDDLATREFSGVAISPALVSNGDGYGLAWVDFRDGAARIYFVRLDRSGARVGEERRITSGSAFAFEPALAWTGREYALAWNEEQNEQAMQLGVVRLAASGEPIGAARHFASRGLALVPQLAWNGSAFALADLDVDLEQFTISLGVRRLAADTSPIGARLDLDANLIPTGVPDLVSNGSDFGIAWNDLRGDGRAERVRLATLGPDGRARPTLDVSATSHDIGGIALASMRGRYGLLWERDRTEIGMAHLAYARASESRVDVAERVVAPTDPTAIEPSIVAAANEFGAAWSDVRHGTFAVYFARIAPSGEAVRTVRVSGGSGLAAMPRIVWNGSEYAMAWLQRGDDGFGIRFVRLTATGDRIGEDRRVASLTDSVDGR